MSLPKRFHISSILSSPWKWLSQRLVTHYWKHLIVPTGLYTFSASYNFMKCENHILLIFLTQQLTQARHRTITTQMDDTGNQRTMDFKESVSPSPGTERNPQDLAIQGSSVAWPGNLVECQGQEPDGNLCQLLCRCHRTEIVSGDTILKAHKIQKYW